MSDKITFDMGRAGYLAGIINENARTKILTEEELDEETDYVQYKPDNYEDGELGDEDDVERVQPFGFQKHEPEVLGETKKVKKLREIVGRLLDKKITEIRSSGQLSRRSSKGSTRPGLVAMGGWFGNPMTGAWGGDSIDGYQGTGYGDISGGSCGDCCSESCVTCDCCGDSGCCDCSCNCVGPAPGMNDVGFSGGGPQTGRFPGSKLGRALEFSGVVKGNISLE